MAIARVAPFGPTAGLVKPGECLLAMNGHRIRTLEDLADVWLPVEPGTQVKLETSDAGMRTVTAAVVDESARQWLCAGSASQCFEVIAYNADTAVSITRRSCSPLTIAELRKQLNARGSATLQFRCKIDRSAVGDGIAIAADATVVFEKTRDAVVIVTDDGGTDTLQFVRELADGGLLLRREDGSRIVW